MVAGPPTFPAGFSAWLAHAFDRCDKTDSLDGLAGVNSAQDGFPAALLLFQADLFTGCLNSWFMAPHGNGPKAFG